LDAGALRALLIGSALCIGAAAATLSMATPASAARPALVRDMCAETSGGNPGLECNSSEDLLVRPKYSDGTCGDWICCPPNGDGSYNCNAGSSPGPSQLTSRLRDVIAPPATLAEPNRTPRRPARAPVTRRTN